MSSRSSKERRIRLGQILVDVHTRDTAVAAIVDLVQSKGGGRVFTPNLDHILRAEAGPFREAYGRADLSLADGMPLVWASRWMGHPLPERVSGADLVEPLAKAAGELGWRVFLLGGAPGTAEAAGQKLREQFGAPIVGCASPMVAADGVAHDEAFLTMVCASSPDLIFVALGSPKQELWIDRYAETLRPAVLIGVGAALDFQAGRVRRAPAWIGRLGFEWLFRLVVEPRRLWRRYLVDGPRAIAVLARTPRDRPTA